MALLNRREFNGLCLALGSLGTPTCAAAVETAAPTAVRRTVKFRDGTVVPALGQGSAGLGKGKHPQAVEEDALRTGLSLGMTLIDTAEDLWLRGLHRARNRWSARSRIPSLKGMAQSCGRKRRRARLRGEPQTSRY